MFASFPVFSLSIAPAASNSVTTPRTRPITLNPFPYTHCREAMDRLPEGAKVILEDGSPLDETWVNSFHLDGTVEDLGRGLGRVPVATHDTRSPDQQLGVVGDADLQPRQRRAHGPERSTVTRVSCDGRALRGAVALDDAHAEGLPRLLQLRIVGERPEQRLELDAADRAVTGLEDDEARPVDGAVRRREERRA